MTPSLVLFATLLLNSPAAETARPAAPPTPAMQSGASKPATPATPAPAATPAMLAAGSKPAAPAKAGPSIQSIDGLAWLSGHWVTTHEGNVVGEEVWLEPKGKLMVGMGRQLAPDDKAFFEYLRIEQRDDGVFYVASPAGKPPTDFKLTALTTSTATFENPAHDFPKRIAYKRTGDKLSARVDDGNVQGMDLEWTRKK